MSVDLEALIESEGGHPGIAIDIGSEKTFLLRLEGFEFGQVHGDPL